MEGKRPILSFLSNNLCNCEFNYDTPCNMFKNKVEMQLSDFYFYLKNGNAAFYILLECNYR